MIHARWAYWSKRFVWWSCPRIRTRGLSNPSGEHVRGVRVGLIKTFLDFLHLTSELIDLFARFFVSLQALVVNSDMKLPNMSFNGVEALAMRK